MPNEDNTQNLSNSNSQVIAAIRALEDRIINVEGIIVARLNDTRPHEHEILARLKEVIAGQSTMQEQMGAHFRLINDKLDVMNDDVLTVRARQRDLEKRVKRLEQDPIESAA